MKTLILLRHGHAHDAANDFGRALSPAGTAAVAETAERLAKLDLSGAQTLCSPAKRTAETAAIVIERLGLDKPKMIRSLYLAPPSVYLDALAEVDENCSTLLVVGHNPGLSELAERLLGRPVALRPAEFAVHTFAAPWLAIRS